MASEHLARAYTARQADVGPDFPTDLRVLGAIASLLALLAGAVLIAVFLIVGLRDDATRISDEQGRYVRAIHEAAVYAKGVANDQRGFLLTGDRVFLRELRDRHVKAQAAFEVAQRTATSEGQRLALEEARTGYDRWWKELSADIATYQAGNRERSITRSLGPTRQLRKDYEATLDLAHILGVGDLESEKTSLTTASSRSVMFLLAYLAVALLIGGAVALWVVRRILKPAYSLLYLVGDDPRTATGSPSVLPARHAP